METNDLILEHEGYQLLRDLGLPTLPYRFIPFTDPSIPKDPALFQQEKIVMKIIDPQITHKSDVGGVAFLPATEKTIREKLSQWKKQFPQALGFILMAYCPYEQTPGSELLLSYRQTPDLGPLLTLHFGGIFTELLGQGIPPLLFPLAFLSNERIHHFLLSTPLGTLLFKGFRGKEGLMTWQSLEAWIRAFRSLKDKAIELVEINPLVIREGQLIPLDFVGKYLSTPPSHLPPRPLGGMDALLHPKSLLLVGVSERQMNPGRIILRNTLREGFPPEKIRILKPHTTSIDGAFCIPSLEALDAPVDLAVLAISAHKVAEIMEPLIRQNLTKSIILIPGGFEEKAGGREKIQKIKDLLIHRRHEKLPTPVINGGNCLGVRSHPGKLDTLFIPEYKLPLPEGEPTPFAFIAQSGAFIVSKINKLMGLHPRYAISLGNQMDLTLGDYLAYFSKKNPDIKVYAVYAEGFKPGDGLTFFQAAQALINQGKTIILYKGGRTQEGKKASLSHTASIAGDYPSLKATASAIGVWLAPSIQAFEDLTTLAVRLRDKKKTGRSIGALSNAGFECVAIGDYRGSLRLPPFSFRTQQRLQALFQKHHLERLVDIHNPLDLTPMATDTAYAEIIQVLMEDPSLDGIVVGNVPLTPALQSLPPHPTHNENLYHPEAFPAKLISLYQAYPKPLVVVIDGGKTYDPLVSALEAGNIPVFRTMDRALFALQYFLAPGAPFDLSGLD